MKNSPDFKTSFRILKGGKISMVVATLLVGTTISLAAPATNALPTAPNVTNGIVNISSTPNVMNINQTSNKSIINWNTYDIGSASTVNYNFAQNGSSSVNRVLSNNPSQIYGNLNANGQVILVNPNGIVFGPNASVNIGSLVATTMNIKDADYLNDKMVFTRDNAIGSIVNEATITAEEKGFIALLSPKVLNEGIIRAFKGTVTLAGADKVELVFDNTGLRTILVEPSTIDTLLENKTLIEADGGLIYIGAKQAQALLDNAMNIKNSGTLQANSMDELLGKVTLDGNGIEVSGTIQAKGGSVQVGNKDVEKTLIASTATLEADSLETSAKSLHVKNGVSIKAKHWLLDPTDITIEESGGSDIAAGSSISASTILTALGSADITLIADNDINVNEDLVWNAHKLTLTAGNDININSHMTLLGTAGLKLNVTPLHIKMGIEPTTNEFIGWINLATGTTFEDSLGSYTIIHDLAELQAVHNTLNGKFVLGTNITNIGDWEPYMIGSHTTNTPFTGIFNGLGHALAGMTLGTSSTPLSISYIGLFGYTANATISNVVLNNPSIYTSGNVTGTLIGLAENTNIYRSFVDITLPSWIMRETNSFSSLNDILSIGFTSGLGRDYHIIVIENNSGDTVFDSDNYSTPALMLDAINSLEAKNYTSKLISKNPNLVFTYPEGMIILTDPIAPPAPPSTIATPPSTSQRIGTFTSLASILPTFSDGSPVLGTDYEFTLKDGTTTVLDTTGKSTAQILAALNALPVKNYTMSIQAKGTNYTLTATATSTISLFNAPVVTATLPAPTVGFGSFTNVNQILPTNITNTNAILSTDYHIILKDGSTTVFDSDTNSLSTLNALPPKAYTLSVVAKGSTYAVSATSTTVTINTASTLPTMPTYTVKAGAFTDVFNQLKPTSFTAGTPVLGTDYKVILKNASNVEVYNSGTKTQAQVASDLATLNALGAGNYTLSIASLGTNYTITGSSSGIIHVVVAAPGFGNAGVEATLVAIKGTNPGDSVLTTQLTPGAGHHLAYALADTSIVTFPLAGENAPNTLTTYTNGTALPAIDAGKYLRLYEIDDATGQVVKFQEKTLAANEIKTPDFPSDVIAKGTVVGSTKVSGLNKESSPNTFAWILSDNHLATPDIGTTTESGLIAFTDGSNIPFVSIGKYLRIYEIDPSGHVVKFEEKTLVADNIKTAESTLNDQAQNTISHISDNIKITTSKELAKFINIANTSFPLVNTPLNDTGATIAGGLDFVGGKSIINQTTVESTNPFSGNSNIDIIDGGLKAKTLVEAREPQAQPILKFATQKGVELSLEPSNTGSEPKLGAKVDLKGTNIFSFTVKEAIAIAMNIKDVVDAKAELKNGIALPSWLKFDKATQTFIANNPPSGALPLTAKVTVIGKDNKQGSMDVEISN